MKRIFMLILALAGFIASAFADTQAQFPGGQAAMDTFIADNMVYPAASKKNGIEGVVNVSFTVKADGQIGTIKIVRMIDPDLEQEAMRLVKSMPAWEPATKDGTAVDSSVQIPIVFQLPGE